MDEMFQAVIKEDNQILVTSTTPVKLVKPVILRL